jgi:hypothetical protein
MDMGKSQDLRKMYADAQKHAQHMLETGDTSELLAAGKDMEDLQAKLEPILGKPDPQLLAMLVLPPEDSGAK